MSALNKVLFLCHRDGLSRAGTANYVLNDMADHFKHKNVEPHCIATGLKPNSSIVNYVKSGQLINRESFVNENFLKSSVCQKEYQKISAALLSDSNFLLIFERNNPFSATKGLFNQFPMLERLVFNVMGFLKDLNPKYVFSFAVPHHFINYCLVRVAELLGITVYFCDIGALPWQYQLYEGLFQRKKIINTLAPDNGRKKVKEWFDNQSTDYAESIAPLEASGAMGLLQGQFTDPLIRLKLLNSMFKENKKVGYGFRRNVIALIKAQILKFFSDRLKKKIDGRPSVNLSDFPFVVFFMHFQPEATTMPNGSHYANQLFAIRELSLSIPIGWRVLVKEHPFTFSNEFSPRYRNAELYRAIDEMKGVQLMSMEYDPYTLIDQCMFVATLTGTVGMQAISRGKPVIAFGDAPFLGVHGVVNAGRNFSLKQYIHEMSESPIEIDKNEVLQSLYDFEKEGFGYLLDDESPHIYALEYRNRALNSALGFWLDNIAEFS